MVRSLVKSEKIDQKIVKLDDKDKKIVCILNANSRISLTDISKQVGLSIDGVKDRIAKMKEAKVIQRFCVIPDPKFFGLPLTSHVYVKFQNLTEESLRGFESYLKSHARVFILMSMVGDYDMYFVILAKDAIDLNSMKNDIRMKFKDLIADWKEVVVAEILKYEEYKF